MSEKNNCGWTWILIIVILFGETITVLLLAPVAGVYWLFTDAEPETRRWVLYVTAAIVIVWTWDRVKMRRGQRQQFMMSRQNHVLLRKRLPRPYAVGAVRRICIFGVNELDCSVTADEFTSGFRPVVRGFHERTSLIRFSNTQDGRTKTK